MPILPLAIMRGCEKIEIQGAFWEIFTSFKISTPPKTARGAFRAGLKFEICEKFHQKSPEF